MTGARNRCAVYRLRRKDKTVCVNKQGLRIASVRTDRQRKHGRGAVPLGDHGAIMPHICVPCVIMPVHRRAQDIAKPGAEHDADCE